MDIKNKQDLIILVNQVKKNKNINSSALLKTIREKTKEFILSQGEIFPNSFLELFENFQEIDIQPDKKITEHINFFNNYYLNAPLDEKFILNNLLFGLEILNGNPKNGLKNFIKRTFQFNIQDNIQNEYLNFSANFILNVKTDEKLFIKIVKEIINPNYFLKQNSFIKRAYFVNILSILWNNPIMTNNKIWLEIFEDLINLMNQCTKLNLFEEHMYIHFFTYHIYGNNIQTQKEWKIFNEKIEIPASEFYKKYAKLNKLIQPKKTISTKKKKIGFLIDRIVFNSPYMVMYSLWKNLLKNKEFTKNYDIYIYSLNYVDKQFENINLLNNLQDLGIKIYTPQKKFIKYKYYYSHLQKAIDIRSKIIEDEIDYLITTASGYDINNFIITNRSAPKQIFWSHGNCSFNIKNIDKRISHFPQECKEFNWKIFAVPTLEEFLIGPKEAKQKAEILKKSLLKEFGKETVFLGTIGRLIKLESKEYLKIISKIMKQNPNTVYLACGSGNQQKIKDLMKTADIDLNRVIFTGQVNQHIFGWIIDIWINTYPLIQGQSQEEYFAKKTGIILESKEIINSVFDENINLEMYKKYIKENNIKTDKMNKIIPIINDILKTENRYKWYKTISYLIKNKDFYNFYKWINAIKWDDYKNFKQKQLNQFLEILKEI